MTALNPYIGYANATEIAQQALVTGQRLRSGAGEKLLTPAQLDQILQPEVLTQPRSFAVTSVPGKTEVHSVGPTQID